VQYQIMCRSTVIFNCGAQQLLGLLLSRVTYKFVSLVFALSRPSCVRQHPVSGHLWCEAEREPRGRCCSPDCKYKHKQPLGFKLSYKFLERTVGEDHIPEYFSKLFNSFAAAVTYGTALDHANNDKLAYGCVSSSREWTARLRGAVLCFAVKLGSAHILNDKAYVTTGRPSDAALERCATALVQWLQAGGNGAAHSSTVNGDQQQQKSQQAQLWRAKLLTALRSFQSLSSTLQDQQSHMHAAVAPTLALERMRLRAAWFAEFFPVPSNAKYLQYVTRDVNVRLQYLLGLPNKDVSARLVSITSSL
jgi:hypothetical protein